MAGYEMLTVNTDAESLNATCKYQDRRDLGSTFFLSNGTLNLYTLPHVTQQVYVFADVDCLGPLHQERERSRDHPITQQIYYATTPGESEPDEGMLTQGWEVVFEAVRHAPPVPVLKFQGRDFFVCHGAKVPSPNPPSMIFVVRDARPRDDLLLQSSGMKCNRAKVQILMSKEGAANPCRYSTMPCIGWGCDEGTGNPHRMAPSSEGPWGRRSEGDTSSTES